MSLNECSFQAEESPHNVYTTRKSMMLLKVMDYAIHLGLKWKDVLDLKDQHFIHPTCSKYIATWAPPSDAVSRYVLGSLYVEKWEDLQAFASKIPRSQRMNFVFAVDGFGRSDTYDSYVDHLKYSLNEKDDEVTVLTPHVRAVRQLHNQYDMSAGEVYRVIMNVVNGDVSGEKEMKYIEAVDDALDSVVKVLKS